MLADRFSVAWQVISRATAVLLVALPLGCRAEVEPPDRAPDRGKENVAAATAAATGAPGEICVNIVRGSGNVQDAHIADNRPDKNFGSSNSFSVGDVSPGIRQALVQWDTSAIPPDATVTQASATFTVLLNQGGTANVHRVTAPWAESTVTYASFNGAYDPSVAGTLPGGSPTSVDLTALAQAWVRTPGNGGLPNHGVLLERSGPFTTFHSSESGVCDALTPCPAGIACVAGFCAGVIRPTLDVCYVPGPCTGKPNGTACDDGNACTQSDTCQNGWCTGASPVACAAPDQCHRAGTCNPGTGQCDNPALADGTACNDGDACTQSDTCQAGTCTGASPVTCAASDQCHVAGTCNPSTGQCSNPAAANGTSCDDGDACTQSDSCQAGTCTGVNPVVCSASDQCHVAGTCNPGTGQCDNPVKANGSACSDGNACTQSDTCQAGICAGANPVVCAAPDQCHNAGTCDPTTGQCDNPSKANGTSCNDGNACTQTDTCQAGTCTGANPVVCGASDQCHVAGTCNPGTGQCSNPAAANGTSCNDGNACTQSDTCQAGTCTGANPVVCAASDQCHGAGTCNPGTGQCDNPALPNGTACNDNSLCSTGDACNNGVCVGVAKDCSDGLPCSVDSCNPSSGGCGHDYNACIPRICGTVEEEVNTVVSPSSGATVSLACDTPSNIVKGTTTLVDGSYCVLLTAAEVACNTLYLKALKSGFTAQTKVGPGNFTVDPFGGIDVDFLIPQGPSACFFDDFENNLGWTTTAPEDGVRWQRKANTLVSTNNAVGLCVALASDEGTYVCPSPGANACVEHPGAVSNSFDGQYAYWFGNPDLGTYVGNFLGISGECSNDDGGQGIELGGTLTSPVIALPAGTASVQFRSWWEIESVDPQQNAFDRMIVRVVDQSGVIHDIGTPNPEIDANGANHEPYTSAGYFRAPVWNLYSYDLTPFAGQSIQVQFHFRTNDGLYNGFRGWLIDDVSIVSAGCP